MFTGDNGRAIELIWQDPIGRTKHFFGKSPFYSFKNKSIDPYQLGAYLILWGELYGFKRDAREICATGRGTGKTTTLQELNAADMACFMPYFLQAYYGKKKPVDVTLVFVGSQKKYAMARMENVKNLISGNPYLERHLVDKNSWTKAEVNLRNRTKLRAEAASAGARGYHSEDPEGVVIWLLEEFAFWGGSQCMSGEKFVEEVAEPSMGCRIGAFTTPYGKRGGAWWSWNHPDWVKFNFPSWANPRTDKKKLALRVKRLLSQGRQIIVDQEIRGRFVDDVGLFFSMEIWLKGINSALDWLFSDQDSYQTVLRELTEMANKGVRKKGYFLLGLDPNEGSKKASADPFGISLVERVGRKYYNRFTTAFNGRSHDEIDRVLKLLCLIYEPLKINWDGGGGYHTGPMVMLRGSPGVKNMEAIPESNQSIVGYMSKLRSLMAMGLYEMSESQSLRESQMAMKSIGDQESEDDGGELGMIKFQTTGKKSGIPCDLAAMGLSVSRENVGRQALVMDSGMVSKTGIEAAKTETIRVYQDLDELANMGLTGIGANLTSQKVGI